MRQVLWNAMTLLTVALGVHLTAFASDCDVDCGKKCYKKRWGIKYDDPACRTTCEARKGACRVVGKKIPSIPGITDRSILPPDPRELYYQQCAIPFNRITSIATIDCPNYRDAMAARDLIKDAGEVIFAARMATPSEFDGVRIRWCPLRRAEGMTPRGDLIYLHPRLQDEDIPEIAATLLHELQHIRQWRRHGESFKCKYSEEYVKCSGCQDDGHRLEREAYQVEDELMRKLDEEAVVCATSAGQCDLPTGEPWFVGMSCSCFSERREYYGRAIR